ncbi:MAG: tRNA (adenosine(37)-N6)-threonylcarbamoyltransferase complex ATPase subunit type 1 TsaE [bacterium]|nr:tRNA (adenosine(37)-N6)-threonylcarbamoyltransferase complex ATPase subunit type 1 TsaE [bacterium]
MKKIFLTKSSTQTKKLGESFAKNILKRSLAKRAVVFGLIGDLGGGKTTFLQGFAKGLGVKEKILSPTFVIMKKFKINHLTIKPFSHFYHIDCYRIEKAKEILGLGFKKIIFNPQNIIAVEWADRIRKVMPKDITTLKFGFIDKNVRKIVVELKKNGK